MLPVERLAKPFLHHRIGDLETAMSDLITVNTLHHRIGDLEIAVIVFFTIHKLHHRIGDLENWWPWLHRK